MTRATLLQLLAHPTALAGADVRALEQLAEAFPYCQTAHLLLAKAAHDQSSMLAGQRLRRAATYAADRARLRQLIELAPPVEEPAIAIAEPTIAGANAPFLPAGFGQAEAGALAEPAPEEPAPASPAAVPEDKPNQIIGILAPEAVTENEIQEPYNQDYGNQESAIIPELVSAPARLAPEPVMDIPEAAAADELPPQAPPVRPPAGAEVARFEFGLAPEEPAEIIAYRLPELEEASEPTTLAAPATPLLPAFRGLAEVSYAPSEGSRLGFSLVAAAGPEAVPGASLPPTGEFFAPDALLLAHLAAHQAPAVPKPSSLDLINSFLQRAPAPTRRRVAPLPSAPEPDEQADLSVRSTRAEPDLASESLAKILARQGKPERAIAVYERLMVKHPEKMAYFAAQIDSLRPSA